MSIIHQRATTHGPGPVTISLNSGATHDDWQLKQLMIHCHVSFTDVCTVSVQVQNHEGTAYNCVIHTATVATLSDLQDVAWYPDQPIYLAGKDRLTITFGTASAALPWGYDAVLSV